MNVFEQVNQLFDELFGPLRCAVFLFDDRGRLVKANRSFLKLAKAGPDDVTDMTISSFLPIGGFDMRVIDVLPEQQVTRITCPDGTVVPVGINYRKLKADDEPFAGALALIRDLREINTVKDEMKQLTIVNEALRDQLSGQEPDKNLLERRQLEQDVRAAKSYLEHVIESCGDGIVIVDGNGFITGVNQSFAGMLGKAKEEIIGQLTYELGPMAGTYHATTGESVVLDQSYTDYNVEKMQQFTKPEEGGKIENWEFYVRHKSGDLVPLDMTITFQFDEHGAITGGVGTARDITERKKAEKEVREAKDFLENVLEACGDGIFITDAFSVITRVNQSFADMLGKTKEEIEGISLAEMGPIEGTFTSTTGEPVVLDKAYRTKRLRQLEEHFLRRGDDLMLESWEQYFFHKSGTVVPMELTYTFQMDTGDEIVGGVGSARDITERKKAEKALHDAQEYRTRFFTNITHEFRTPLTLAIGPVEGILRGEFGSVTQDIHQQLAISLKNSRRLLKLVTQLLDLSRLRSGGKSLLYEKKEAKAFVSAILDFFSHIAEKKKINLIFVPHRDVHRITIDAGKMEKVLFNLIGNAFKFTPEGGNITVSVEPVHEDTGDYIKLSVKDTGIGIKQEEQPHIFTRFTQAMAGGAREQAGTGIGLAHAKELVEFMGGRITLQSEYAKGSTFSVYVPAAPVQAGQEPAHVNSEEDELYVKPDVETADVTPEEAAAPEGISGTKPLVLVVDDNPDVCRYIAGIVKRDYDYSTAASGREGLSRIQKHTPDIILCDVMMPEMDGYGFLRQVKADAHLKKIPFVFITARADIEMKIEGLEEGADDYIVKPFNSLELLARIKALLRIRDLLGKTEVQQKTIEGLTGKLQDKYSYGNIIGSSPAMRALYQMIDTVKDSDASILVTGETGTGKELIANAVHYNSPWKDSPMISVNCGAIPKELMEREFFGHVKGAYTGAVESRRGYFEEADGGTLFLDEIGEMDKNMQVKLLRVLERKEIVRIGDTVPKKVHVRIIAATNKDLLAEVHKGAFREDLYYRIYVVPLHVPPLRQRREDIPVLIEHFLQEFRLNTGKDIPALSEEDMERFLSYTFPGNVRELKHLIERYCLLGGSADSLFLPGRQGAAPLADGVALDDVFSSDKPLKAAGRRAKARAERDVLLHALGTCSNDYRATAKKLNISIASFYSKIKEYGIGE